MARLVLHSSQQPVEVKIGNESKWVCTCGLSKNKPFCDGYHKKTSDEESNKIYIYDKEGKRVEVQSFYD
ncbi:CDGSH iron-sulfur domain-containing protein [Candidatus Woesearchaeota archaeon]|nr:CDGSH iron-sulfur domain-containing protein [Candidatus Woesearchaeota archaeon]